LTSQKGEAADCRLERVISLDLNLRPAPVGDLGQWWARFARYARTASIIKLSIEDLHTAHGAGTDPEAQARRWLDLGVGLGVVTLGRRARSLSMPRPRCARPGAKWPWPWAIRWALAIPSLPPGWRGCGRIQALS
jgi:sugar/nucleoside kinase (ribokinase family)